MAIIPVSTDYTDKDFDALRQRLQNLVRSVFPEWTDYNVANFGNILLEMFAFVGDVLLGYQDNQALNSRISTATQRRALINLVKLVSYTPSTADAAQADVVISLGSAATNDIVFPAGTVVKTDAVTDPIRYRLLSAATILSGQTSVTTTVENSEEWDEGYQSTGLANQSFQLSRSPYIDGSETVTAANGAYSIVANFLDSTSTDRHYTVQVDQNDRATFTFGNGVNGAIPVGNIDWAYRTGGGSDGRVEAGALNKLEQATWYDGSTPVQPSVTNPNESSGGNDRESVEQIKANAPATVTATNRCVTKEDFETNVGRLSWVARSLMLTSDQDPGVPENTGYLYIITTTGSPMTAAQSAEALTQVTTTYPSTLTFQVEVRDAVYQDVDVYASLYLRDGYTEATVKANVEAALEDLFAVLNDDGTKNEGIDFGANVKDSEGATVAEIAYDDVRNAVHDAVGVRKIGGSVSDFTLNEQHNDVIINPNQFPRLGTVTLYNGETGQQM